MKRFFYAVAAVAGFAAAGAAQQPVTGTTTPTTPAATPVVTSGTPVMDYAPSTPARRGLFGRLRSRNTGTMAYSSPAMGAPVMSAPVMTTPMTGTPMQTVPPPQAMPGAKPNAMMTMPTTGMVAQATGNLPPGTYTTTDGTVVQVGGTMTATDGMVMTAGGTTMTTPMPAQTTTSRGLFGRLRNR